MFDVPRRNRTDQSEVFAGGGVRPGRAESPGHPFSRMRGQVCAGIHPRPQANGYRPYCESAPP